jgi:hypothetical protein
MLPVFTFPLAFLGLLGVPVLVGIYWFRNRHRRYPVSSLMLWLDPTESRAGGTRLHRLQTPLLFFLELLTLVLLVLAAAGPQVRAAQRARPLVVVLDDSYSMLAGGQDSARSRAVTAIAEEVRHGGRQVVRFVLAGDRPVALGDPVHSEGEAVDLLKEWKCRSSTSRLAEAVSLASELGGEWALILVVTDHAPDPVPEKGRLEWWAFGRALPNVALVNAARTARDGPDRCLFEVANLSADARTATLLIEADDPPHPLQRSALKLEAGETRRIVLELKGGTGVVRAKLDEDDLAIDNQAILLPVALKTARVGVQIADEKLRPLVKALQATRIVVGSGDPATTGGANKPDIVFTDSDDVQKSTDAWVVRFLVEKEAEAYTGPFVLDRAHPLTEGLGLQAVIWGAGTADQLPGAPVILAGNIPLLTDSEGASGRHELRLRLRPDLSTLQDSPDWPILMWNLVQWHGSLQPGLRRANLRLGEDAVLTFAAVAWSGDHATTAGVQVVGPDRQPRTVPVRDKRVVFRGEEVGLYDVTVPGTEDKYQFALNALSRDESDLTGCVSGRWGDWLDETSLRLEYQAVDWLLLLLAVAVVTLHLYLVARESGRVRL